MAGIIQPGMFPQPLTSRERFRRVMHYQSVDRVPHFEFGYWNETYRTWHQQGLPERIDNENAANAYFGFDRFGCCPVNDWNWLCPPFEPAVLEEDEKHRVIIDADGIKCMINKDGSSSIPHVLEYPLKNRQDWLRFKERLDPDDPKRFPPDWPRMLNEYTYRDYALGLHIGSLLGLLRDWIGFEQIALMFYDDPDLLEEMIEYLCQFNLRIIDKLASVISFDYANGWEDIAFKNGPLLSPAMFKRFLAPRHERIAKTLHGYGIDVIFTDCDGDINALVEFWLASGFNCMFPLEVGCGTDPVALRDRYGKQLLLIGGVNKRQLIAGKRAIDEELARLAPLVEEGGFIPHVDHRCPPDVTLENYLYYMEGKKKILGYKSA